MSYFSNDVDCYVVFDHDLPLYDGYEYLQGPLFYVNHGFKCILKDCEKPLDIIQLCQIPGWKYGWSFVIFAVMPGLDNGMRTSMVVCDLSSHIYKYSFTPNTRYYKSCRQHVFFLVKFYETKEKNKYLDHVDVIYVSIMKFDYESQKLSYIRSILLSKKFVYMRHELSIWCGSRFCVYYIPILSIASMPSSDTSFHIVQPWRLYYEYVDLDILTDNRKTDLKRKRPSLESGDCVILEKNGQRKTYDEKQIVHSDDALAFLDFCEYLESMQYMHPLIQLYPRDKVKTRKFINYVQNELRTYDTLFDWTFDFFHRRNPSFFEISSLNDLVYYGDITELQPYSLLEWLPYDCIFRLTSQLSHFIFETEK